MGRLGLKFGATTGCGGFIVGIGDHHIIAFAKQHAGNGQTDAFGGAGDQSSLHIGSFIGMHREQVVFGKGAATAGSGRGRAKWKPQRQRPSAARHVRETESWTGSGTSLKSGHRNRDRPERRWNGPDRWRNRTPKLH